MKWSVKTGYNYLHAILFLSAFANISCTDENYFINEVTFKSQPYTIGDTLVYVEASTLDTQQLIIESGVHRIDIEESAYINTTTQYLSFFLLNLNTSDFGGYIYFGTNDNEPYVVDLRIQLRLDSNEYNFSAARRLYDYMDTISINDKFYRKVKRDTTVINGSLFNLKAEAYYETVYSPIHGCLQITDRENQLRYYLVLP